MIIGAQPKKKYKTSNARATKKTKALKLKYQESRIRIMSERLDNRLSFLLLGVLVGIYGNWLISFLDRLVFPTEHGIIFYIQVLLAIISFLLFPTYIGSAFYRKHFTNHLWVLHTVTTLITLVFQHSFVINDQVSLNKNMVFWTISLPLLILILVLEWFSSGRAHQYGLSRRWKNPKIGVLNDMGNDMMDPDICTYTDLSPLDWKEAFDALPELKATTTNVNKPFDSYVAILNPYGGVYPESDLKDLSSFKKILDFVREGGIFINIADIPSYWAYDPKIKRKLDTTSPVFKIEGNQIVSSRPFELTPLVKGLGLKVFSVRPIQQDFSDFSETKVDIFSERIAVVESNLKSLIPIKIVANQYTSSFFSAKYGEGDFIISLVFFNYEGHNQQAKDTIMNAILTTTRNKILRKISLREGTSLTAP